jgi:Ca2+-binding RTX toxin-like protein
MTASADPGGVGYDGFGYDVRVVPSPAAATTVFGLGGDDVITATSGILTGLVFDGGDGNDTITGGDSADLLIGGAGNDVVTGGRGSDTARLGDGDDTFVWNPGDGSDVVDGELGIDALAFNGANANEDIELSAVGTHVSLSRDVGAVVMDLAGVERFGVAARGGTDRVVIDHLAGTPATEVNVDLGAIPGTATGDALADTVLINGTSGVDVVDVALDGDAVTATGFGPAVRVRNGEPALDRLAVNAGTLHVDGSDAADTLSIIGDATGLPLYGGTGFDVLAAPTAGTATTVLGRGGDDVITASGVAAPLTIDGGDGNDTITGGGGDDLLIGGAGNDVVTGGHGSDTVRLGDGDDTFAWNPGDGSDVVDGELGADTMSFHGANVNEVMQLAASGARARLVRDIGTVAMDVGGIERIAIGTRGGADSVLVGDLTGTPVAEVDLDLAATEGTQVADGVQDALTIMGSSSNDVISIAPDAGGVAVSGLPAQVRITGQDAFDQLTVSGGAGADTFFVAPGTATLIGLSVRD